MYKIKADKLATFFDNFSIPILFLWSLWFLYPLIVSGFVSDDSYISQVRGMLYFSDIGIFDRIAQQVSYELSMGCLLYTSPSPRDGLLSRMPSSA